METGKADRIPASLRGFGPLGLLAMAIILAGNFVLLPLSAVLVLLWAQLSRTPWSELGFSRPRSWIVTIAGGIVFGTVFKLLMKTMVMPLLGAPPVNAAYHYIAGNADALPGILAAVIIGAGFGEEVVFRGYLFERLGKLLGWSTTTKIAIVLITSIWFALGHYAVQGLAGSEQAFITGLVFGSIFAVTRRIWMVMIAHAAFDVTAVAIIYWNAESRFAHLFFR